MFLGSHDVFLTFISLSQIARNARFFFIYLEFYSDNSFSFETSKFQKFSLVCVLPDSYHWLVVRSNKLIVKHPQQKYLRKSWLFYFNSRVTNCLVNKKLFDLFKITLSRCTGSLPSVFVQHVNGKVVIEIDKKHRNNHFLSFFFDAIRMNLRSNYLYFGQTDSVNTITITTQLRCLLMVNAPIPCVHLGDTGLHDWKYGNNKVQSICLKHKRQHKTGSTAANWYFSVAVYDYEFKVTCQQWIKNNISANDSLIFHIVLSATTNHFQELGLKGNEMKWNEMIYGCMPIRISTF